MSQGRRRPWLFIGESWYWSVGRSLHSGRQAGRLGGRHGSWSCRRRRRGRRRRRSSETTHQGIFLAEYWSRWTIWQNSGSLLIWSTLQLDIVPVKQVYINYSIMLLLLPIADTVTISFELFEVYCFKHNSQSKFSTRHIEWKYSSTFTNGWKKGWARLTLSTIRLTNRGDWTTVTHRFRHLIGQLTRDRKFPSFVLLPIIITFSFKRISS